MNNVNFSDTPYLTDDVFQCINYYETNVNMNFVNSKFRNEYFKELQNETNQKIGCYQKNLILEGLPLVRRRFESELGIKENICLKNSWDIEVKPLFYLILTKRQMNSENTNLETIYLWFVNDFFEIHQSKCIKGEGIDRVTLAKMSIDTDSRISSSAKDIINQLCLLSNLKESIKQIKLEIFHVHQLRDTEKTMYSLCGGKKKFQELKILELNEKNSNSTNDLGSIRKLEVGCAVMRGIESSGSPFIAIRHVNFFTDAIGITTLRVNNMYLEVFGSDLVTSNGRIDCYFNSIQYEQIKNLLAKGSIWAEKGFLRILINLSKESEEK